MDGKLDLERIGSVIKSAEPDLVLLQEVDRVTRRTGGIDQCQRLGELTGLHAYFGDAMDYQGGSYGLAILSRWRVISSRVHPLPADPGVEPRILFEAALQPGEGAPEITVFGTHLDAKRDPEQRMKQAKRIRELLPPSTASRPMILAGDLNATPESEVSKVFLEGWIDSAHGSQMLTSPANSPRSRIDYILYRPPERWRVIEVRVLEEAVASDPRPVLAVLELLPSK